MAFTSGFVGKRLLGSIIAGHSAVYRALLLYSLIKYLLWIYDTENRVLHLFE